MKLNLSLLLAFSTLCITVGAQKPGTDKIKAAKGQITVQPINHATFVLSYQNKNIYVDPVGGASAFKGMPNPDVIVVTDIHGDHLDVPTLEAIINKKVTLIVPQAVADKLSPALKQQAVVIGNGETTTKEDITFEAIPMYNLPQSADAFHTKGRGNGYVITLGKQRIYISGDTEAIPEMLALKNIDIAFVCMNLPYTMDVKQASRAVLEFKPSIVYPYHYRGQDINEFKALVNAADPKIDVRLKDWYAK